MQIDAPLKLPFLSKKKSVKDQVISSLSTKKSMSGKELHEKIIQENGRIMTYQALYKVLKTLENEGIISKNEKNFELNPEWIDSLKDYASSLEHAYSDQSSHIVLPTNLTIPITIEFKDLTSLPITFGNWIADHLFTEKKATPAYGLMRHGLWPLRFNFHDYLLLKKMVDNNPGSKCAIVSSSPFDQWIEKHYKTVKMLAKAGVGNQNLDCDIIVHGDVVCQIYHSVESQQLLDKIYSEISDIADLFNFYIRNKIDDSPVKIRVVIQKNKDIAKLFKDKIDSMFENKS